MPTFSFEDGYDPTAAGDVGTFVPAKRTSITDFGQGETDDTEYVSDKTGTLPTDANISKTLADAASKYGVPPEYAYALADQESGYNPKAFNSEFGAAGMFQYIPDSAKERGIDPYNVSQAADAAMADFAKRMKAGGVEEAILSHFAGPGGTNRGPKSKQYLADVQKRAKDIRDLLLANGDDTGGGNVAPEQKKTFAFEEGYGPTLGSKPPKPTQKEPIEEAGFATQAVSFLKNSGSAIADAAESGFDFVMRRMKDGPNEYLGKKIYKAELTPEESKTLGKNGTAEILQGDYGAAQVEARQKAAAQDTGVRGFLKNVKNPIALILQESLPSNFVQALTGAKEEDTAKFWKARQITMQENIVAHPEKFPEVAVQAAQAAIDARRNKQDPGVREMWDDLKSAAKSDPGKFGAQFLNALMADPEMLLAPEGMGLKILEGTSKVAKGAELTSKIAKIADKVVDAGSTGAALNLGITAAADAKEGKQMTGSEAAFASGLGFAVSGMFGALARGKVAREKLASGEVSSSQLDDIIRDAAKEDVAVDNYVNSKHPFDNTVKHRIEQLTGVKFESKNDLKQYLQTTRKEWKQLFEERDLHGQYQEALAEERTQMRLETQRRSEAAAQRAAEDQRVSSESHYAASAEERRAQFQDDWEKALAQRDAARAAEDHSAALRENELRDATARLDEQEIIYGANSSVNEVKRAMVRAAQRDSMLRTPKWQRGEVDPRLVTRLGIGSLFAGTAYALAPEKDKGGAAFAAALAGFLIPGGGSVLDRMRQSGVISPEGDIIGLLVKEGKLKVAQSAAEDKLQTNALIDAAKKGDQQAYGKLYNEHFPRIHRYVRQFVREAGPRLGVDAEDVAQETFVAAFKNLHNFNGDSQFYTWLHAIARNKGLEAIRDAKTAKGGGDFQFTSMYARAGEDAPGDLGSGHLEGSDQAIKSSVEAVAADGDTPDALLEQQDAAEKLQRAIAKLPEKRREIFLLNRVEQYTAQQIAEMKGVGLSNVLMDIKRASDFVTEHLAKDTGAKRVARPETSAGVVEAPVKRGRGRPPGSGKKLQAGEVDPKLLLTITGAAGTAALGAYLVDNGDGKHSKKTAALGGAALGLLIFGGGAKGARTAARMVEDTVGVASTTLLNHSPQIFRRAQNAERRILENTHAHIAKVDPFLVRLNKLTKEGQQVVTRALLTGNSKVINNVLAAINDPELLSGYKQVRSVLDSLGDQLVALNRFKKGNFEYFPRIVKDKEGLFKAIGKEAETNLRGILQHANAESIRKNGRPLTQIEEAALINETLFANKTSTQPGFTKGRGIEEITPELLPFYATPAESIHTYIRSAVQDIEKAKFFGRYAKNMKKGQFEFLDTDRSINNLLAEEIRSGNLNDEQASHIADVLKARFGKGELSENDLIRNAKNLGNMGLLGNLWSAASQLSDVAIQVHVQGLTSTMKAVVRQLTGRKILDVKDFGLVDHISEEFAGQLKTTKYLNTLFKVSLFAQMDRFGKNTALNGAITKGRALASGERGVSVLSRKYGEMFGDDFSKLVSDLKAGKVSDITKEYAWLELSRTQPISRLEMPVAYLNNPNLRTFWWLKSFTLKQFDLLRRDAYNEIKKGNVARGLKNLATATTMMGVGGAGTQMIKDWMMGRDHKLDWADVPINMFRNLGFSAYTMDQLTGVSKEEAAARRAAGETNVRAQHAKPLEAVADMVAPPYKHFQAILTGDPKAVRYLVPVVGPWVAERIRNAEIERKKLEKEENDD